MKIIKESITKCTSIKIMVNENDNLAQILYDYKKLGFKPSKRPNAYSGFMEDARKYSPEGIVYTLVKYEPFDK